MSELDLDDQTRLVKALQDPTLWSPPVDKVQVRETHISWVLLAGEYAFKLKKAVDFGFLDYSTLEKRRWQCEREVTLNRRTAPMLYLNVLPVSGSPERPRPGDPAAPIDYLVKMRRFDENRLLARLVERGELDDGHMQRLARAIATFQERAAAVPAESEWGTPETVWHFVAENFTKIRTALGRSETALDNVEHWSRARFAALSPQIRRRREEGFVRDGHGDLHLNNIVLIDSEPVPFDCIEFNDALRFIDVINELAFLLMDLQSRQRKDLAAWLLNDWLFIRGDYAGVPLLRFFIVYRAMVRAKVAALRLAQPDLSPPARADTQAEYQAYLQMAEAGTQPQPVRLVITHGLSGSGKSTLVHRLLGHWPAIHLRSDVERKRLFGLPMEARSDSAVAGGIYTAEATDRTYARLADLARTLLAAGWPVVVDATFLDPSRRAAFRRLAETLYIPFTVLDLTAPPAVLRKRIRQRLAHARDASEADLEVLAHQLEQVQPPGPDEPDVLRLDTTRPIDLQELARYLAG